MPSPKDRKAGAEAWHVTERERKVKGHSQKGRAWHVLECSCAHATSPASSATACTDMAEIPLLSQGSTDSLSNNGASVDNPATSSPSLSPPPSVVFEFLPEQVNWSPHNNDLQNFLYVICLTVSGK